ncbi:MAG: hypothetical protein QOF09_3622 [Alphaproteobacteria bacterium]|jgi:hypothetical protein|nr:hypothetical protein [Alphaproteobacteria bacterium]
MKKKRSPKALSRDVKTMILGRARFTKISAVEGIVLTPRMEKRIADFERAGLSAKERRESVIRAYRKS